MSDLPRLVRRIYPTVTACPACGGGDYEPNGSSRVGLARYRTCKACGEGFKVFPTAIEVLDVGSQISRIEPCADVTWTSRVSRS